jgi:hypothetical protein
MFPDPFQGSNPLLPVTFPDGVGAAAGLIFTHVMMTTNRAESRRPGSTPATRAYRWTLHWHAVHDEPKAGNRKSMVAPACDADGKRRMIAPAHLRNYRLCKVAEVATEEPLMAENPTITTMVAIPNRLPGVS